MRYVRLGPFDSGVEEDRVCADAEAGRIPERRVVEYVRSLQALDKNGFDREKSRWITTFEPKLVLFTGRSQGEEPTKAGGRRIWAAIELDEMDRVGALIKIVDDYEGDAAEFNSHLLDALNRYRNGVRFDE